MALVCAAKSCKALDFENDNCNLVFFPFPEDEETCHSWILRSGRHDLLSRTVEEIHVTEFLCERHFEDHCLDRTGPLALRPKGKPSLFDHDMSQFAAEIEEEKSGQNSLSPDIVVIPCVIMDAGVNTEVIGYNGESVKEDSINRTDIERELQLMHESGYVSSNVLSENGEGLDVHHQVIDELQPSVEDADMLDPDALVVDSIHAVDSSEWQEGSLTHLVNELCRICANENIELISIFEERSIQHRIVDKIQWHLPIVIKEDDKLPLKICTNCASLINSWHDLVATCIATDTKLRKLFNVDEQFDPAASVYCDLNSTSPEKTLETNVTVMQNVLNGSSLVAQTDSQSVVDLEDISLQAADDSISLDISKSQLSNPPIPEDIEFFTETKELEDKSNLESTIHHNISMDPLNVQNISTDGHFNSDCTPTNDIQETLVTIKEEPYYDAEDATVETQTQSPAVSEKKSTGHSLEESLEDSMSCDNDLKDHEPEEIEVAIRIEEEREKIEIKKDVNNKLSCDICGFCTMKKRNLLQHISRKHSSAGAQIMCEYCDKMFASETLKKLHERSHIYPERGRSTAAFVCEYCGLPFHSKKTLKEHHIALHSDDRPYKCDKCDKNYGSLSSLDIHKATHSSETPYLCDLCGKTFKHVSNLRCHKRSHLDESDKNRQICPICGKGFRSRFHLSEHMNVHDGNRPYTCEVCGKRFHKKIQLRQHGSAHSGTQPYKCHICGVKFNRRGNMTQHVKRHSQERKYTCRVCNESFPTLGAVLNHRKKHTDLEVQRSLNHQPVGDDPDQVAFKCNICGKLLAKKESLTIHMQSHSGEKLYPCPVCGKRLSKKGSLAYHIRSFHTGERPHACQFCGDGFLSKEARLVHERIHTGEKPYKCLMCSMAFRCSSNLAQHLRVHSDARPHPCNTCGKRFQRKGALDVHMRTHTGERPYVCDICGRAFTQKNDMLKHRRTHNQQPFSCDICGDIFSQKRDLTKHKATKHNAEDVELSDVPTMTAADIVTHDLAEHQTELTEHQAVVITTENLLSAFPEINVPGIEHSQTVILQRF